MPGAAVEYESRLRCCAAVHALSPDDSAVRQQQHDVVRLCIASKVDRCTDDKLLIHEILHMVPAGS